MSKLYIPVGVPGCGKSTWAKSLTDAKRISSDEIRRRLFGGLGQEIQTKEHHQKVFDYYHDDIEVHLELGLPGASVLADATNLDARSRKTLYEIAFRQSAQVHVVLFKNVAQAVVRNSRRIGDERVPHDVMARMAEKYGRALIDIPTEAAHYDSFTTISDFS